MADKHSKEKPEVYNSLPALSGMGSGAGGKSEREPDPAKKLPYLEGGYFDNQGHLRREVFIDWPREKRNELKATKNSLRSFYTMLRNMV